ncbi:MAG: hypothetical protein K5851_01965 [Lachnospiraceae bacterium]|nr:hypothetical protein [Lachnospiraceae bacterium]
MFNRFKIIRKVALGLCFGLTFTVFVQMGMTMTESQASVVNVSSTQYND